LERIHRDRIDAEEDNLHATPFDKLEETELPPCVTERAAFMLDRDFWLVRRHPYTNWSPAHKHLKAAMIKLPAYSAGCVPFRRMLKSSAPQIALDRGIHYVEEKETLADREMGTERTQWVQHGDNQDVLLRDFFRFIRPDKSLCFFYAKRTPLVDDPRRVIIGVGHVTGVSDPVPYGGSADGPFPAFAWDVPVQHSIRSHHKEGFLLPYHEALEAFATGEELELAELVAFAPDEAWGEFSYATEHVSADSAIAALISCSRALERAANVLSGGRDRELAWIAARMSEIWRLRGPCPGLGPALHAFGVRPGTLVAHHLSPLLAENEDPWPLVERLFENPRAVRRGLERYVGATLRDTWRSLKPHRKALLQLMSRFQLTQEQAERIYQETERKQAGINIEDHQLLENPYLLYELDRGAVDAIPVAVIDRGLFPDDVVRANHALPEPSAVDDPLDARRVRALVIDQLEAGARDGHTLRGLQQVVQDVREAPLDPECPLSLDVFSAIGDRISPLVLAAELAEDKPALQLDRLAAVGARIRKEVSQRRAAPTLDVSADWHDLLGKKYGSLPTGGEERQAEERAREEKAAVLAELASRRLSCLVGSAGTGKTTMLSVLCQHPEVADRGVLLLAPTGKARVQLATNIRLPEGERPKTIAEFLVKSGRYEPGSGRYRMLRDQPRTGGYRTVVIDEASMLTEEMLAATLDELKGVERLILVGDPRQLPPIGPGRPFVDIVREISPPDFETRFPRVAYGLSALTVPRRQSGRGGLGISEAQRRSDLLLAEWFSGEAVSPGADEIWQQIASGETDETLRVRSWQAATDLHEGLLTAITKELELARADDVAGFERQALGGVLGNHRRMFFNRSKGGAPGAGKAVEAWQILSPVRASGHGIDGLNRMIQQQFRHATLAEATDPRTSFMPRPKGPEQIIYGDKVMCVANRKTSWVYGEEEGGLEFVANGEIGAVVGVCSWKWNSRPEQLEVEFSTQPGFAYKFSPKEFSDDGSPPLQLAYAITVHKSQGSEFTTTFLVIPDPCPNLSRELLYTALTRQRENTWLFFQGSASRLRDWARSEKSETRQRLTNLFAPPKPVAVGKRFLEERLIHQTERGDLVRSKSELIIADALYDADVEYDYEPEFTFDGVTRWPDFYVDDAATGRRIYWEHLGMLNDPVYRQRWERKLDWYHAQDIREDPDRIGGKGGLLIVTRDDQRGGISSMEIKALVRDLFE
jgi:ATP-dependent exoDNAse (exonuclease V) alpha subunit